MTKKEHFCITSPDGFPIERDTSYDSPDLAWQAFEQWKKGFERQGCYAPVRCGERIKIPLALLKKQCGIRCYIS